MVNYELMLIINPSLSEDENKSVLESVKSTLAEESAKITKEDIWGEKKMAYKINKSEKGFYVLFELEMDGTSIEKINGIFNLNQDIWRYMFVKQGS